MKPENKLIEMVFFNYFKSLEKFGITIFYIMIDFYCTLLPKV